MQRCLGGPIAERVQDLFPLFCVVHRLHHQVKAARGSLPCSGGSMRSLAQFSQYFRLWLGFASSERLLH